MINSSLNSTISKVHFNGILKVEKESKEFSTEALETYLAQFKESDREFATKILKSQGILDKFTTRECESKEVKEALRKNSPLVEEFKNNDNLKDIEINVNSKEVTLRDITVGIIKAFSKTPLIGNISNCLKDALLYASKYSPEELRDQALKRESKIINNISEVQHIKGWEKVV